MLRYQGVIFDMDGVLCRTDRLHYRAWVRFTDKYGLPFSEELHETMLGLGREACMDTVLGEWGKTLTREEKDALILEKNDMFRELAQNLGPQDAAPGVRETLAALREMGLRLAIGSSSQNAPFVIGKLQLAPFFDAWVDGTQMEHCKPAPDIFLEVARRLSLPPKACLVVDDGVPGLEAALRGGFAFAGIGPSARDLRCTTRLTCFSDLLKAVCLEEKDACH